MSVTAQADGEKQEQSVMNPAAMGEFQEELSRLRSTSGLGGRDKLVRLLGALTAGAGLLVILLSYKGATAATDLRDQMELLILAVLGLGLVLVGMAVFLVTAMQRFLRFWMLRLVYEQRDLTNTPR